MEKNQTPQLTLKEVLESYKHIELTEDEIDEAILLAKRKKEFQLEEKKKQELQINRRSFLTQKTNYDLIKGLMQMRAKKIFKNEFMIDDNNSFIFELLCRYFGNDPEFVSMCVGIGIDNASLDKGLLICGVFGTGKTWMMKLFKTNQRQCFEIVDARELANRYKRLEAAGEKISGDEIFLEYGTQKKNAVDDPSVFYQPFLGLCLDDMGNEDIKNSYGNKKNLIAELIEIRYLEKQYGQCFHATTNLTADQIEQYYGGRVRSRIREIFNFIELPGPDRRK